MFSFPHSEQTKCFMSSKHRPNGCVETRQRVASPVCQSQFSLCWTRKTANFSFSEEVLLPSLRANRPDASYEERSTFILLTHVLAPQGQFTPREVKEACHSSPTPHVILLLYIYIFSHQGRQVKKKTTQSKQRTADRRP